ncbi:zinc finger protein 37-like [Saccostrea cucullata]|uniref:zinc finger protein 37-like n=1 Tax=Saccostrea cuccullata TaxID=36930 RepID=UPI002ED1E2EF
MPLKRKVVARKRQSVQIRGTKETSLSPNTSQEIETCPVCNKEKLEVHPIESNKLLEIRGCDFCGLRYLHMKHSKAGSNIHCIYCYKTFNDTKIFQTHLQDHSKFFRTSSLHTTSSSSPSLTTHPQEVNPKKRKRITPQPREDSEGFQVKGQDIPETSIEDVAGAILTLGSSLRISNKDIQSVENWTLRSSKTASMNKTSKLSRSASENQKFRLSRADTVLIGDSNANSNKNLGISRSASENKAYSLSRADTIVIEPQIQISDQSQYSQTGCSVNKESTTRMTRAAALASGNTVDLLSFLLPDTRPTRQDSNASDSTTILSDEETSAGQTSLKKDDTFILEVSDNEGNVSSQFLMTLPSFEKMSDLDLNKLYQDVLNTKTSSVGRLASDDTIDRILPGFSKSIISLLQEDEMVVVSDQNQGKSFQIRRIPSGSSPANDSCITQELPVNSEQDTEDNSAKPIKKIPEQVKQLDSGKLTRQRKNRQKNKSQRKEGPGVRKRGRHVERETHTCSECGKVFSRRYNLKVHKYIHTEQKNLECQFCHQQFKHDSLLRNHIRIKHTGNKPFTCETCGQGFIHNNYLQRHMLLHAGDVCKCCDEKFESRRQFNVHVKNIHVEPDSTKRCQKCKLDFVSLLELTRHLLGMKDTA